MPVQDHLPSSHSNNTAQIQPVGTVTELFVMSSGA